jgi:polyhydroxyalkanoate depolymerase
MYEAQRAMLAPMRAFSRLASASIPHVGYGSETVRAGYELWERFGLTHVRPPFGIASVTVDGRDVAVHEERVSATPFATLLRFRKDLERPQPRVLIVAPLSGHFATLLRGTIRTMLPDHDVYVTDWHNAREIAARHGRFGVDEYIEHVIAFLHQIGPGAHVVAVCQPCVTVLAAVAVMAHENDPAQPRSMTLMAGPVDTRSNPTSVNVLAKTKPLEWYERNVIATVPWSYRGAGRRVYPGFVQVSAFMNMNFERHVKAHQELFGFVAGGDRESAEAVRAFYDEYFAVFDLTAEFYLETVRTFFQEDALARGTLTFHGRPVDPGAIAQTALLTVEGENDDICGLGQTFAAHGLCTNISPAGKRHHVQAGVGHYGVFNGARWQNEIYPLVRDLITAGDATAVPTA